MRRARRSSRWACALAASGLALASCISGPAPRDHFYRIDVPPPAAQSAARRLNGVLVVNRLRTDPLTNERQILFRDSEDATEVGRLSYHRWVDSPTVMIQAQIADYLRAAGAASLVVTPGVRVRPDYLLDGRLASFEWIIGDSPHVLVALEISITRVADDHLILFQNYQQREPVEGDDLSLVAAAFDRAIGAVLARLAADIPASRT